MKINKKLMTFGLLGLFALTMVTAGSLYYASIHSTVDITQPIKIFYGDSLDAVINNTISESVTCDAGSSCNGKTTAIMNKGIEDRIVIISSGVDEDISVRYMGPTGEIEGGELNVLANSTEFFWVEYSPSKYATTGEHTLETIIA